MTVLRLYPTDGSLEGYGLEGRLKVYESSLRRGPSQEPLLTVCAYRHGHPPTGLRLTRAQAFELSEFIDNWLEDTA